MVEKNIKRSTVILTPIHTNRNQFIGVILNVLSEIGFEVIDKKEAIWPITRNIKAIYLNWYENLKGKNDLQRICTALKKLTYLLYIKYLKHAKIFFTLHNKNTHEGDKLTFWFMRWIIKKADKIILMNKLSFDYIEDIIEDKHILDKCVLIPHPNYLNCYTNDSKYSEKNIELLRKEGGFALLFFGYIKPYKNIEILLNIADLVKDDNIQITIIGSGEDEHYIGKLKEKIDKQSNVKFINEFVSDEAVMSVIRQCDCVILPYNMDTVLNSGVCILALSAGRNVICPEIGTMIDFPKEYTYLYHYDNEREHIENLYYKIVEVYEEFNNKNNLFWYKAEMLFKIIEEKNSYEVVRRGYESLL